MENKKFRDRFRFILSFQRNLKYFCGEHAMAKPESTICDCKTYNQFEILT